VEAFFGEERLLSVLRHSQDRSAGEVQEAVLAEVRAFVGEAPQFDDLTLMILVRNAA
jgi:serine phosphatase RsbU (regulator of sigma subunit)